VADIGSRDAIQPALLDRLTDDDPSQRAETREHRVFTKIQLRAAVLRDLAWLFNSTSGAAVLGLDRYPLAAQSTLNYGLPAFSGKPVSSVDLPRLDAALKEALLRFEPRILPHSLSVRSVGDSIGQHNVVSFQIVGELWAHPYPVELLLKTDVDLESGKISIAEGR
jgi:type VI secretion system protein ImpF